MPRYFADVDSPPAKPVVPLIQLEDDATPISDPGSKWTEHKSPARRRRVRRLKASRGPTSGLKRKKTTTRCAMEIVLLGAIAASLCFFGFRDLLMSPWKPSCLTTIPDTLLNSLQRDLNDQIFRQEAVTQNISSRLATHNSLTIMSFIGACGTGKSLTASVMAKHFGEDRSHGHHWPDSPQEDHLRHVKELQEVILGLPYCQPQLLVVENLTWRQKPYVEDLLRWLKSNSGLVEKNLVVVLIFNLENSYEIDQEKLGEAGGFGSVGELEKTDLVKFKSFQETDAMDYLVHFKESQKEKTHFKKEHLADIVASAQVRRYGLKRLAKYRIIVD